MTTMTLELQPEIYLRLLQEAHRQGQPAETIAATWITDRLPPATPHPDAPPPAPPGQREREIAILRESGLLAELGPEIKARAARSTATLEEVQAAFARAGGKPLSEIIDEMRGPKG